MGAAGIDDALLHNVDVISVLIGYKHTANSSGNSLVTVEASFRTKVPLDCSKKYKIFPILGLTVIKRG